MKNTIAVIYTGGAIASLLAALSTQGKGFAVAPLPAGAFEIEVNREDEGRLTQAIEAADEELASCAELLLRAYARGEDGESVDWDDVGLAFEAAMRELPGRYQEMQYAYGDEEEDEEEEEGERA
jgi:hypothetical protein